MLKAAELFIDLWDSDILNSKAANKSHATGKKKAWKIMLPSMYPVTVTWTEIRGHCLNTVEEGQ